MDIARSKPPSPLFEAGMNRPLYTLGWSYVALCGLLLAIARLRPDPVPRPRDAEPPHQPVAVSR